jgi:hypothetical protein
MTDLSPPDNTGRNADIAARRDAGASWLELQREFGLSRQQTRHAYQVAKREERRRTRRGSN